jgi:hypothetical protein
MSVRSTCAACKTPIDQAATGRPRKFCSEGCRRSADLEVRRLDRQLDVAETGLTVARDWLAKVEAGLASGCGTGTKAMAEFDVARGELRVADLQNRLRGLLDELQAGS